MRDDTGKIQLLNAPRVVADAARASGIVDAAPRAIASINELRGGMAASSSANDPMQAGGIQGYKHRVSALDNILSAMEKNSSQSLAFRRNDQAQLAEFKAAEMRARELAARVVQEASQDPSKQGDIEALNLRFEEVFGKPLF
jgi:hypothetical protein